MAKVEVEVASCHRDILEMPYHALPERPPKRERKKRSSKGRSKQGRRDQGRRDLRGELVNLKAHMVVFISYSKAEAREIIADWWGIEPDNNRVVGIVDYYWGPKEAGTLHRPSCKKIKAAGKCPGDCEHLDTYCVDWEAWEENIQNDPHLKQWKRSRERYYWFERTLAALADDYHLHPGSPVFGSFERIVEMSLGRVEKWQIKTLAEKGRAIGRLDFELAATHKELAQGKGEDKPPVSRWWLLKVPIVLKREIFPQTLMLESQQEVSSSRAEIFSQTLLCK